MFHISQDHLMVLLQVKPVTSHHQANRPIQHNRVLHNSQVNLHNRHNLLTRGNLLNQVSPSIQFSLSNQASLHILSTLLNSRFTRCHNRINQCILIIALSRVPPISIPLNLKAVTTLMVNLDRLIIRPKVPIIILNNPATPILSSQIHRLLKWG